MPDKLDAVIKYIEKRDNAKMIEGPVGFIMVRKTKNNCRHHGTCHTGLCNTGVNVTCDLWEWKGL